MRRGGRADGDQGELRSPGGGGDGVAGGNGAAGDAADETEAVRRPHHARPHRRRRVAVAVADLHAGGGDAGRLDQARLLPRPLGLCGGGAAISAFSGGRRECMEVSEERLFLIGEEGVHGAE